MRLSTGTLERLRVGVARPAYARDSLGVGIVHLGIGAFFRSHLAQHTDEALEAAGGSWRICGVSLRTGNAVSPLTQQDGLYTVLARGANGNDVRVVGSIARAYLLAESRAQIEKALVHGGTKIVSLTVTEKAYCYDRGTGMVDARNPGIAHDLANPDTPVTAAGLIVQALARRRDASLQPFAVMSCDNLLGNGRTTRSVVCSLAGLMDEKLASWIEDVVSFPSTMVDRITPATTESTLTDVKALIGLEDGAAVECEEFRQWVVEDRFPHGRPAWEEAGAIMVSDVTRYEEMKLRMLNGAHSLLAYAGHVAGYRYVGDCMECEVLGEIVRLHMDCASESLSPLDGISYGAYRDELCERFRNPALAHETYQIAADGTQKMPQRIFAPAADALRANKTLATYAFACAAWVRFCQGVAEDGSSYEVKDPIAGKFASCLEAGSAMARVNALMELTGFADSEAVSVLAKQAAGVLEEIEKGGVLAAGRALLESSKPGQLRF